MRGAEDEERPIEGLPLKELRTALGLTDQCRWLSWLFVFLSGCEHGVAGYSAKICSQIVQRLGVVQKEEGERNENLLGGLMGQVETEKLMELLLSAALSRALCTVAALGVADQIEPGVPQSADYIAGKTGAHPRSLYRILRFLAGHGVFREQTDRQFDHTPLSVCLRTDAEGSFRPAAIMFHRIFPAWEGLDQAAKSGEPGLSFISERPLFDHVRTDPELASLFDAGMTAIHGHETRAMLEAYDFGDVRILADIGGGNGSLIGAVLADYPEMQGILFDLGHVGERSRNHLDRLGVLDRCCGFGGRFPHGSTGGS